MGLRLQQRVVLVLAIDVHQRSTHFSEQTEGAEAAVYVDSVLARAIENPSNHQLAFDFESRFIELGLNCWRHGVEQGFHGRLVFLVTYNIRAPSLARDQPQGIENN